MAANRREDKRIVRNYNVRAGTTRRIAKSTTQLHVPQTLAETNRHNLLVSDPFRHSLTMQLDNPAIHSARVVALRIPTDFPESDGTADWDATTVLIVQLASEGEEALGYSYGDSAAAHVASALLQQIVLGKSPLMI